MRRSSRFVGQVMLSAAPCYVNDGAYMGRFNAEAMEALLPLMYARFEQGTALQAELECRAERTATAGVHAMESFLEKLT